MAFALTEHRYVELFLNSTAGGSNGAYGSQMMGGMGKWQRLDIEWLVIQPAREDTQFMRFFMFSQGTSRLTAEGSWAQDILEDTAAKATWEATVTIVSF